MSLTEQFRPKNIDDIIGQYNLTGPNGILRTILINQKLQSVIFYGPPGTGKTTTARILAVSSNHPIEQMNCIDASIKDIKTIAEKSDPQNPTVLYLDEIQYFNKKQQQSLLPLIENNQIILIASTTENPYYCCYKALLSRCIPIEFKPVANIHIYEYIRDKILPSVNRTNIDDAAVVTIANTASGDVRRALNLLELILNQYDDTHKITIDDVKKLIPNVNMGGFDTDSDTHYALISALQKSIRGSDPNAAVFYLARLLEGGDILSPCRRLLVIANEDIGLANPSAIAITYACVETAKELGMPEAAKPLTNAVILLATSPKANTAEATYNPAADDIKNGFGTVVPAYLQHACSPGYLYPHNYPNHWVEQQYLPDDLKTREYYKAGDNQFEQNAKKYWNWIKNRNEW